MTDRLTDRLVADMTEWGGPEAGIAREVQASRKLIADLLALHCTIRRDGIDYCIECGHRHPCPTVRLIKAAQQ